MVIVHITDTQRKVISPHDKETIQQLFERFCKENDLSNQEYEFRMMSNQMLDVTLILNDVRIRELKLVKCDRPKTVPRTKKTSLPDSSTQTMTFTANSVGKKAGKRQAPKPPPNLPKLPAEYLNKDNDDTISIDIPDPPETAPPSTHTTQPFTKSVNCFVSDADFVKNDIEEFVPETQNKPMTPKITPRQPRVTKKMENKEKEIENENVLLDSSYINSIDDSEEKQISEISPNEIRKNSIQELQRKYSIEELNQKNSSRKMSVDELDHKNSIEVETYKVLQLNNIETEITPRKYRKGSKENLEQNIETNPHKNSIDESKPKWLLKQLSRKNSKENIEIFSNNVSEPIMVQEESIPKHYRKQSSDEMNIEINKDPMEVRIYKNPMDEIELKKVQGDTSPNKFHKKSIELERKNSGNSINKYKKKSIDEGRKYNNDNFKTDSPNKKNEVKEETIVSTYDRKISDKIPISRVTNVKVVEVNNKPNIETVKPQIYTNNIESDSSDSDVEKLEQKNKFEKKEVLIHRNLNEKDERIIQNSNLNNKIEKQIGNNKNSNNIENFEKSINSTEPDLNFNNNLTEVGTKINSNSPYNKLKSENVEIIHENNDINSNNSPISNGEIIQTFSTKSELPVGITALNNRNIMPKEKPEQDINEKVDDKLNYKTTKPEVIMIQQTKPKSFWEPSKSKASYEFKVVPKSSQMSKENNSSTSTELNTDTKKDRVVVQTRIESPVKSSKIIYQPKKPKTLYFSSN